jgi:hypothetical protein
MIGAGGLPTDGGVVADRGQAVAGVAAHGLDAVEEGVADQDVVDELALPVVMRLYRSG